MQKKLIALAVAAALTAPAAAMAADVTVYGKAFLNIESVNNNKNNIALATNSNSAMRINSNASRLGFKVSEDLGDDLKALVQYEVQMDLNGNVGNGLGNGTRNSGVGLEGGFGKAIVGIWDSPYKVVHNKTELFDNTTVFTAINLIGRANGNTANYNTRQKNMIQYWSPKFAGLQAAVSYSPDAAQTATKNATVMSLSGTYDVDAIYVALGFENRADVFVGTTDSATRLTGRYNFGPAWLGATFESIKVNTALTTNYTQQNLELVGQFSMTEKDTIGLSYAKAGKTNVTNTGASQVSLRVGHNFSKTTEIFAAYTSLKNDAAQVGVAGSGGNYNLNGGTAFGTGVGSTISAFGVGLIKSF